VRRSRLVAAAAALSIALAVAVSVLSSRASDWSSPVVLVVLLATAILADRFEMASSTKLRVVGSLPAFVLAAVLLGPAPAVALGIVATVAQRYSRPIYRLTDLSVYAVFPLAVGLLARLARDELGVATQSSSWLLLVAVLFIVAWLLNFGLVGVYMKVLAGRPLVGEMRATWVPLISSQLALSVLTATLAGLYVHFGVPTLVFAALVMATYQKLQSDLLQAQTNAAEARRQTHSAERSAAKAAILAREAREQSDRLARTQVGIVRAMVDSVHARDRMTARHSAAVARYAGNIAAAAGCTLEEQELVHTAGLLHDVGKFIFSDQIFWSAKLTDDEWALVKRHPEQGAEIVGRLEGHERVAEIILAHHERIDGKGYPRGLCGDAIPRLARMISIADTYDVMTSRDSYREPVAHEAAVAELRRVAGAQLDAELVEVFVEQVLGAEGVDFRHNDDADFEAELDFERRVHDYVTTDGPGTPAVTDGPVESSEAA
jgi:putative nucleotidyltransferase with HDIG domain